MTGDENRKRTPHVLRRTELGGVMCCRSTPDGPWQQMSLEKVCRLLRERSGVMALVRGAYEDHYKALDNGENRGVSMQRTFLEVEKALDMHYIAGASRP